MKKPLVAKFLVLCMVLSMLAIPVAAEDAGTGTNSSTNDTYSTGNDTYSTGNDTYSTGNDTSTGGGSSTTTPATSADESKEVEVTATVSGTTATVSAITDDALTAAAEGGSSDDPIVIDLSDEGGTVTAANLPTSALEKIEALDDASGLTVKLTSGDVTLDDDALEAITEAAGTSVELSLTVESGTAGLSETQRETLTGLDTAATFTATVKSNGETISDFKGGTATLSVPFTPPEGKAGTKYMVYYVPETGSLQRQTTSFADGKLSFRTTHFSDYVAIFEPFVDAHADEWHAQYLQYVYDNGLMRGVGSDAFKPDALMTRAMMATVLYRLNGATGSGVSGAFSDVTESDWFFNEVNWAASVGVTNGVGGGSFAPNGSMTREQMAQFMYNYAKATGKSVSATGDLSQFGDADSVSDWAVEAMSWAVGEGLIAGIGGNLNPQSTATRAQLATVLTRFAQLVA